MNACPQAYGTLLMDDLDYFLDLGFCGQKGLQPKEWARKCYLLTLETLNQWTQKYGKMYRQLVIAKNHFQDNTPVSFEDVQFQPTPEQQFRQSTARNIALTKYAAVKEEFESRSADLVENVAQMESCFRILVQEFNQSLNGQESKDRKATFQDVLLDFCIKRVDDNSVWFGIICIFPSSFCSKKHRSRNKRKCCSF